MNDSVIEVDALVKCYESVHAVEDLTFNVERGTTCALLGANGRQDHDHRHAAGAVTADQGFDTRARRGHAAPSSPRSNAHELNFALRRPAAALKCARKISRSMRASMVFAIAAPGSPS